MSIANYSGKEEAEAHRKDMGSFADFMDGECGLCHLPRKYTEGQNYCICEYSVEEDKK